MRDYLQIHNFVGNFSMLEEHTYDMLKALGLWETFGKIGWGFKNEESMFQRNLAVHRTASASTSTKKSYYTPELLKKVRDAYKVDYALFDALGISQSQVPITGEKWSGMKVKDLDVRYAPL